MPIRSILILLSIVLTSPFLCLAQQDDDPVRIDSSIVRLNVGVVDDRGRPVTTLGRGSFSIYEDGVKQDISSFVAAPAPFSVVMMLDMSGSTRSFRQNIQMAASRFLDALAPDDRLAVVEFYSKVNLLNDFTTDRRTAFHSISVGDRRFNRRRRHGRSRRGPQAPCEFERRTDPDRH
jgi:VWFA-related protein